MNFAIDTISILGVRMFYLGFKCDNKKIYIKVPAFGLQKAKPFVGEASIQERHLWD